MSQSSFDSVATEIIQDSIRSAIFIDDQVQEPFEQNSFTNFSDLHKSFMLKNCSLDFFRYESKKYNSHKRFALNNRDLVILDWQLDENDPLNNETLSLLADVVSSKSIHFCCIYTQIPIQDLGVQVLFPIIQHFSKFNGEYKNRILSTFLIELEQQGLTVEDLRDGQYSGLSTLLIEYVLYNQDDEKSKLILKDLGRQFDLIFGEGYFEGIKYQNSFLICLAFELSTFYNTKGASDKFHLYFSQIDGQSIYLNNTLIIIRNKTDLRQIDLYDDFKSYLISERNIFFTLLGLELRNYFKDSSAFIGKDTEELSPLSLFYHYEQLHTKSSFYEFLKEIWKDQAASFLLSESPKIFDSIEEYKVKNGYDKKLKNFSKKDVFNQKELAKLNVYYNILHVSRKEPSIRFGDIFQIVTASYNSNKTSPPVEKLKYSFLLCLTPHCDCLRPAENIGNLFHFVGGIQDLLSSGLRKGDRGFHSFIEFFNEPICVDWKESPKPFSIYIPEKANDIKKNLKVKLMGYNLDLAYHCTLKDNYAQRIANKAFGHPLRVGIDFANIK